MLDDSLATPRDESDHPRACGERPIAGRCMGTSIGPSSPRVRGTLMRPSRIRLLRTSPRRGTPRRRPADPRSDHPRACGERGSSRPARCSIASGYIPARAGNARSAAGSPRRSPVQPRACGERDPVAERNPQVLGTAPRVRGTLEIRTRHVPVGRYSPARAGNADGNEQRRSVRPVQPRACGERDFKMLDEAGITGTAPRVRGTLRAGRHLLRRLRYSPARAGNALSTKC